MGLPMKLLDQLDAACRTMNFASATRECYRRWVEDFLRFHFHRAGRWVHPNDLRELGVREFLSSLAIERQLAASTQSQAMCALGSPGELQAPPDVLLHGTSADALATVLATGLRPMSRAFVHLTSDPDYAAQVVTAKGGGVVLRVRAREAATDGIEFYKANPHVWLAREVPSRFLRMDADAPVSPQTRRAAAVVVI